MFKRTNTKRRRVTVVEKRLDEGGTHPDLLVSVSSKERSSGAGMSIDRVVQPHDLRQAQRDPGNRQYRAPASRTHPRFDSPVTGSALPTHFNHVGHAVYNTEGWYLGRP